MFWHTQKFPQTGYPQLSYFPELPYYILTWLLPHIIIVLDQWSKLCQSQSLFDVAPAIRSFKLSDKFVHCWKLRCLLETTQEFLTLTFPRTDHCRLENKIYWPTRINLVASFPYTCRSNESYFTFHFSMKTTMARKCHIRYYLNRSSYFQNLSYYYHIPHAIINKNNIINTHLMLLSTKIMLLSISSCYYP